MLWRDDPSTRQVDEGSVGTIGITARRYKMEGTDPDQVGSYNSSGVVKDTNQQVRERKTHRKLTAACENKN